MIRRKESAGRIDLNANAISKNGEIRNTTTVALLVGLAVRCRYVDHSYRTNYILDAVLKSRLTKYRSAFRTYDTVSVSVGVVVVSLREIDSIHPRSYLPDK